MFKKYVCARQYSLKECAAACIKTVMLSYGGDAPISVLSDMCKTTKYGTNAYNLIECCKSLGFDAKGLKCSFNELVSNKYPYPLIVHTIIDKKYKHYIVIHKIGKKMVVADPARGIVKLSYEEFKKIWTGIVITMIPKASIPNIRKYKNRFSFFTELISKYKPLIIKIFIFSFMTTAFSIFSSFYLKYIIDSNQSVNNFYLISFIVIITIILKTLFSFIRNKLLLFVLEKLDFTMHSLTFKHILSLPYKVFRNKTTGEVVSRINDLSNIKSMLAKVIVSIGMDFVSAFLLFIVLFIVNKTLFFICLMIVLLYLIIYNLFKNKLMYLTDDLYKSFSSFHSYMSECIHGFESIKSNSMENMVNIKFRNKYVEFLKTLYKRSNLELFVMSFKDLVGFAGNIFILFIGMFMVIEGSISLGGLIMFNSLLVYFLDPIRNLIDMENHIRDANISFDRVKELLEIDTEENNGIVQKKFEGRILVKNLSFSYDNKKDILKSINLEIFNGEKILIMGKSGSGKSTILKLLYGHYKSDRGVLFIDGNDINDYETESLRKNISYISQRETLWTDTVFNNITCDREVSYKKVINMCILTKVDEFIKKKSYGYDFLLEENGFNISGGEKQRIILARNLLFRKNIILLDEATSEMDSDLEREVLKSIFKEYNLSTLIMISHRSKNSDLFDKIYQINNGVLECA